MPIKQMREYQRLDFRILHFIELLRITRSLCFRRPIAFRIHIRLEQNVLPIRRPQLAIGFGRNIRKSMLAVTVPVAPSKSAIQICDPFSLVETNANRFPSGAHRGRSAS